MGRVTSIAALVRGRRPPLTYTVLVSLLLHLSMITVFNVVIYLPREDTGFVRLQFVQAKPPSQPPTKLAEARSLSLADPLRRDELVTGAQLSGPTPVQIALPTLEFAESRRLRLRHEAMRDLVADEPRLAEKEPQDSWARFTRGLHDLGRSLVRPETRADRSEPAVDAAAEPLRFSPAEGFEGEIEWSGQPEGRQLLFAPPLRALWQPGASAAHWPLEIVLEVNPAGRVINAWSPNVDAGVLLDELQIAALRFIFEPLEEDVGQNQLAIMHVRPTPEGAP